jgi:hypothetical protein
MQRDILVRRRARALAVVPAVLAAVLTVGCDDSNGPGATVFSSLSIDPASAVVCSVAPGNTVTVTATARDQAGQPIAALGNPAFTTSNPVAATVDGSGLVSALGGGVAEITASLTADGSTHTATSVITVPSSLVGQALGSVSENHPLPHRAAIDAVALAAGSALNIEIQGEAMHSHTLAFTATQVLQIAAGCRVLEASSTETHSNGTGPHSHRVTFN